MAKNNDNRMEREDYFKDRAGTGDTRFHAVPHDEEGWAVKKEGQNDPELTTDSRSEAVSEAKRMAEEAGTMAYIHDEDGKIKDQFKYNN
ncbi:DUF2188 domain-containing protein [Mesobacillus boroniphilus]|uniref:DUF2188 domain-containing protein n=1 Tax=Mesobacillus boroniphilus TaxID=308892 RepID=A0A944GYL2_9BACI|nr:DUF2188 domain-containing protein [Mesobacillus boroniphilus]MBS8265900.1 DUF2188 domain-containing protein [Mesobacillus boroniphilus]